MKIPKEVSIEEVDDKLQNLIGQLDLSQKLKIDDIKSIIYHENDLKGSMKIINAFTDYAKGIKQFNFVAETINLAWNYLPHKSLNDLSPFQKYNEYYLQKKVKSIKPPKYKSNKTTVYQLFEDSLPEKIAIKKQKSNEWSFVFSNNYHQAHEEFHKFYMSGNLPENELAEKTFLILLKEPNLMEASSYLAHLLLKLGEDKKAFEVLEKSIRLIKNVFPIGFNWEKDQLPWYFLENREFLNLLLDQAIFIEKGIGVSKSVPYYEQILSLNPNDNQGVRGILTTIYLKTGQYQKVVELNKKYPDDGTQELIMGAILAYIKLGKVDEAENHLKKIYKYSKHVVEELLKPTHQKPEPFDLERIMVGGEDEAYLYWREQGFLWQATKGAMDLLRKVNNKFL